MTHEDALERLRSEAPKILEHFFPTPQISKTIEEMGELTCELARLGTKRFYIDKVQEEIADCLIMLYQMRDFAGHKEVDQFLHEKLDRVRTVISQDEAKKT